MTEWCCWTLANKIWRYFRLYKIAKTFTVVKNTQRHLPDIGAKHCASGFHSGISNEGISILVRIIILWCANALKKEFTKNITIIEYEYRPWMTLNGVYNELHSYRAVFSA